MSPSIDAVLQSAVAAGAVPNVVAVAADRDGVIYAGAAGPRVAGGTEPVGLDTTYRLASMTKLVTVVAALQLAERGALDLDAPVETYLPEFASLQVLDGSDGDTPRLRPPASKATVHQLVTLTSGLGLNANPVRWDKDTGTFQVRRGSNEAFASPLVADPGTRIEYGNNADWLGRVIEAVGGETLDKYVAANVTGPLGMDSATFRMSPAQRAASTPVHVQDSGGAWVATELDWDRDPDFWAGGHGLYCTPRDFLTFQRMLLGGGTLDGVQVLGPGTVEAAFRTQIGDLKLPTALPDGDLTLARDHVGDVGGDINLGWSFGYGLLLTTDDVPGMRKAYSGAWSGLFNTHFWIDPTSGLAGSIYSQCLPFRTREAQTLALTFEHAVYASRG